MFIVTFDTIRIIVYTLATITKYLETAGDPRKTAADLFLKISDDLYISRTLTRKDLYHAMGYESFDWAYPQQWADSPEAIRLFKTYGDKIPYVDPETGQNKIRSWQKGDPIPALVWCYDDREGLTHLRSVFGYPVFDKQVIRNLGRAIQAKLTAGAVEHMSTDWLDKKENDADLYQEEINQ